MRAPGRTFAVAAALALGLTACGGGADGGGDGAGAGEAATSVTLDATDELAFDPSTFTVAADEEVDVQIDCGAAVEHSFVIEGVEGDAPIAECAAGESGSGTFTVEAGDYTFYCNIPGHQEAGMEGTFTAS